MFRNQPYYNLCHITCFKMPLVNSVYNGNKSIAFLGPEIWELFLEEVKQKESLKAFKDNIKNCHQQIARVDHTNIFYMV